MGGGGWGGEEDEGRVGVGAVISVQRDPGGGIGSGAGVEVHESSGGSALELQVQPGSYRARILFYGLGSISEDGLSGSDRYG